MEQGHITFTLKGLGSILKAYHHDWIFHGFSSVTSNKW